ncbi:prepilin-type N-terminal cleavage/methylation domain-containing protein [Paenalkalicoccus suaedae]|uniref:Prepilin-type N-terminal cleavage/methylation domain-containing protein n=2 Tax=Paenalkalicoccus suaedae TaxID=2592382 RepID=A0A859FKH2_9BACI|nr:prepilin-type N-terminal cleavage/methylation domain-containing protein [Paenalkalicoccus suaedae]
MQKMLKNQKGLTLVELLAVIVILGIIAAIAIPAIANIIDNSRKDAHIANAEALVNASRLAIAGENIVGDETFVVVGDTEGEDLVELGYMNDSLSDPDGGTYDDAYVRYTAETNSFEVFLDDYLRDAADSDTNGADIEDLRGENGRDRVQR